MNRKASNQLSVGVFYVAICLCGKKTTQDEKVRNGEMGCWYIGVLDGGLVNLLIGEPRT